MPQPLCLLDENVDVRLAKVLKLHDLNVQRVVPGSSDQVVFAAARQAQAILITNDSDFANTLLYPPRQTAGIIVFDVHPPSLFNLTSAINRLLASLAISGLAGKLCTISHQGISLSN